MYDAESLLDAMHQVGSETRLHPARVSRLRGLDAGESEAWARGSLIVEAHESGG